MIAWMVLRKWKLLRDNLRKRELLFLKYLLLAKSVDLLHIGKHGLKKYGKTRGFDPVFEGVLWWELGLNWL